MKLSKTFIVVIASVLLLSGVAIAQRGYVVSVPDSQADYLDLKALSSGGDQEEYLSNYTRDNLIVDELDEVVQEFRIKSTLVIMTENVTLIKAATDDMRARLNPKDTIRDK